MNLESICSESLNKELAYLLGVYLSDGSITVRKYPFKGCIFQLQVIDRDFAERTLEYLKKILPECKATVRTYHYKRTGFKTNNKTKITTHCVGVGFTKWKDFFWEQTGMKHHIPSLIWNAPLPIKKWFIAGVMDGDGWVAIATKGRTNPRFNIGIGKTEDSWIWEFKQFLEKLGVKTNKPEIIPAGYRHHTVPFVRMKLNVRSFISKGLFFTIERKQKKLKYAIQMLRDVILEKNVKKRPETIGCIS